MESISIKWFDCHKLGGFSFEWIIHYSWHQKSKFKLAITNEGKWDGRTELENFIKIFRNKSNYFKLIK